MPVTVMNTAASRINAKQTSNGSRQDRHAMSMTAAMMAVAMILTRVSAGIVPRRDQSSSTGVRCATSQPATSWSTVPTQESASGPVTSRPRPAQIAVKPR